MSITTFIKRFVKGTRLRDFAPDTYWEDRHRTYHDSHKAVGHTGISAQENEDQYGFKRSLIIEAIDRHLMRRSGRTLLDAGCGIGLLTRRFADAGFAVTGVDFSATAVGRARATVVEAEFVVAPLASLELNRRFDVVVLIDVLLHVVDGAEWTKTLTAICRHLSDEGVLVIVDWFDDTHAALSQHVCPRSLGRYEVALASLGCAVVEHTRFQLEHEQATKDLLVAKSVAH